MTNVTASEGESIEVCVEISSPNATVLSMSEISGTFRITTDGGIQQLVYALNNTLLLLLNTHT